MSQRVARHQLASPHGLPRASAVSTGKSLAFHRLGGCRSAAAAAPSHDAPSAYSFAWTGEGQRSSR
eukprot:1067766-Prymnesium_polylepis.2